MSRPCLRAALADPGRSRYRSYKTTIDDGKETGRLNRLSPILAIHMGSGSLRAAVWSCAVLAAIVLDFPSHAAEQPAPIPVAERPQVGEHAFVEFHARSGPDIFGHSFIVYGRTGAHGKMIEAKVAGLRADEENYWKGMFFPIRGSVGRSKDDLTRIPEVVYRRNLTAAEFSRLKAGVNRVRAIQHSWHLLFFNCNDFAGEMAELLGLRRPPSLMLPITYVALLSALNGGQMPRPGDRR